MKCAYLISSNQKSSTLFKMFPLGFTERDSSRVNIKGVDPDALTTLIDYVYTSQVGQLGQIHNRAGR